MLIFAMCATFCACGDEEPMEPQPQVTVTLGDDEWEEVEVRYQKPPTTNSSEPASSSTTLPLQPYEP